MCSRRHLRTRGQATRSRLLSGSISELVDGRYVRGRSKAARPMKRLRSRLQMRFRQNLRTRRRATLLNAWTGDTSVTVFGRHLRTRVRATRPEPLSGGTSDHVTTRSATSVFSVVQKYNDFSVYLSIKNILPPYRIKFLKPSIQLTSNNSTSHLSTRKK